MIYRIPQDIQDILSTLPSGVDRARLEGELQILYREAELFNVVTLAAVNALGMRYDDVVPSPTITPEEVGQIMTSGVKRALEAKYDEGYADGGLVHLGRWDEDV